MATEAKKAFWGDGEFPPVGVTCSGSSKEDVFEPDENGVLKKVGERDLQKEYNAAAVGVTPYEVIDRCVRTGDLSALNVRPSQEGDVDFSGIPESITEVPGVIAQGEAALADELAKQKAATDAAAQVAAAKEGK